MFDGYTLLRQLPNMPITTIAYQELIGHLRQELDADQAYLILAVVFAQLFHGVIQIVGVALHEIVVDIVNVVFVHHLLKEIVNVEFRSAVDNGLHLVEQLIEINALCVGYVVEGHLPVNALDDFHFQHRLLGHRAHTKFLGALYLIFLTILTYQVDKLFSIALGLTGTHTLDILQFLHGDRIDGGHLLERHILEHHIRGHLEASGQEPFLRHQ